MKKYLLLLLTMLTTTLGAWAQTVYNFDTESSVTISADGNTITIHVNNAGDFNTWRSSLGSTTSPTADDINTALGSNKTYVVTGKINANDVAKLTNGQNLSGNTWDFYGVTEGGDNITSLAVDNTGGVILPQNQEINVTGFNQDNLCKFKYVVTFTSDSVQYYGRANGNLGTALTTLKTQHSAVDVTNLTVTGPFGNSDDVTALSTHQVKDLTINDVETTQNQLISISGNTHLQNITVNGLYGQYSSKSGLNLSNCSALQTVTMTSSTELASTEITGCSSLTDVTINNTVFNGGINLSGNTSLANLTLNTVTVGNDGNNDFVLNLSGDTALRDVDLSSLTINNRDDINISSDNLDTFILPAGFTGDIIKTSATVKNQVEVNGTEVTLTVGTGGSLASAYALVDATTKSTMTKLTIKGDVSSIDIDLPSTLESITLPAGTEITDALKARLQSACPGLYYIYSPTSQTQDSNQTIADNVYVVKSGGLKQAFINEDFLRSSVYIKVSSFVALNADDVDFATLAYPLGKAPTAYEYLDFSDANLSVAVASATNSFKCQTTKSSYRLILPDGWSADDMAEVAKLNGNGSLGNTKIAAIYSYTGKNLKIMELSDNAYQTGALSNTRIVRDNNRTESIEFVSVSIDMGGYNQILGKFGHNALAAVNDAYSTIKSVKISTNSIEQYNSTAFTDFTFDNDNITTLDLTGLTNNGSVEVNVNGCANLEVLVLNGVHVKSVTANIPPTGSNTLNKLTSVSMSDIDIDGDMSFQKSAMTSFVVGGTSTIDGNIDLSYTTNLTYVDVVGVTFADLGTSTGDLILYRDNGSGNVEDEKNVIYDNLWSDKTNNKSNIKVSNTFNNSSGVIKPSIVGDAHEPFNTNTAGTKQVGCAWTINLDSSNEAYNDLQKVLTANSITDVCNLTINCLNCYQLDADDITAINGLHFSASTETATTMYRQATLNLDGAAVTNNNILESLAPNENGTIRNIILPRSLDKKVVSATTFDNFKNTAEFNGAISLNAERTALTGYVKNPGTLRTIMMQVPDFRPNPYQYMQGANLPNVTLSGSLLASDLATTNIHVLANGNYAANPASGDIITTGTAFENVSTLRTLDISNAIFVDAKNPENIMEENMTLSELGWSGIVSLQMPNNPRMTEVPDGFLRNCQKIPYLCIPYYYEVIGSEAFYLAGTNWITTTDKNGAEVDNGINTYTFSKNLKQIGRPLATKAATSSANDYEYPISMTNPVFGAVTSGQVHDVYILRNGYEDAGEFNPTKCYRGAFASGMTYGWGGFDGGEVYCREKYKNGSFLFTVLHYPDIASLPTAKQNTNDGLTGEYDVMEKSYTDITKVYTKKDQTGAVDANGDTPEWPTFSELGRAYNQAIRGLVWDDWNITGNIDSETGKMTGEINGGSISFDAANNPADATKETNTSGARAHWDFTDYVGWHEFVLSKATYVAPDETVENEKIVRNYVLDDNWYTFCIPFDMTEDEVYQLLGVPYSTDKVTNKLGGTEIRTSEGTGEDRKMPEIRTISGVVRNSSNNSVMISTSESLSSTSTKTGASTTHPKCYYMPSSKSYQSNTDAGYDTDVYLRAGYPYLIKPYVLDDGTGQPTKIAGNNLGKQVVTRYAFKLAASALNHEATKEVVTTNTAFARPYEGHKVPAVDQSGNNLYHDANNTLPYNYTFIGQFWKQELPDKCFYMSNHKWYHYSTHYDGWYWNPYVCIIMVTDESNTEGKGEKYRDEGKTIYPAKQGEDSKGGEVFDKNLKIEYKDGMDDAFTSSARSYTFMFDEDIVDFSDGSDVTAIDGLDSKDGWSTTGKVYNMNGQHVGNSLNGLSKGMYIVNGRKVVIK